MVEAPQKLTKKKELGEVLCLFLRSPSYLFLPTWLDLRAQMVLSSLSLIGHWLALLFFTHLFCF